MCGSIQRKEPKPAEQDDQTDPIHEPATAKKKTVDYFYIIFWYAWTTVECVPLWIVVPRRIS